MVKPLLSIITVCFNSEKTIKRTINSILDQSETNFEYIIIDGKSTDSTLKIIESFENEFKKKSIHFLYISEKDSGIYQAFNKGIKLSSGDWISFIGSDDYYLKDALTEYFKVIKNNDTNRIDYVYSNVTIVDENNKIIKRINDNWKWPIFRRYMNIPHVGSLHNINYFKKFGVFDESYKIAADYELLLRANKKLKTFKVDRITVKMLDGGASNKNVLKAFKETFKAKNKTGKINFFTCMFDYILAVSKFYIKKILRASFR